MAHIRRTKKPEILEWFSQFPWDLQIEEYEGNCVHCHKKTDPKLNAAYHRNPDHFLWIDRMEKEYGHVKPESDKQPGPRKTYRKHRSAADMMRLFEYLGPPVRPRQLFDPEASGGCAEACEVDVGARIGRAA